MEIPFRWFMDGKIDEQTIRDATEWLIWKGIILCGDIII